METTTTMAFGFLTNLVSRVILGSLKITQLGFVGRFFADGCLSWDSEVV